MNWKEKLFAAAAVVVFLSPLVVAQTAQADKEKDRVLRQLDAAAKNFHSTAAEFQFDVVQTDPVPDRDVQKGVVYYERKGAAFQMAAHIREANDRPTVKVYSFAGGVFKLYEGGNDNRVTTFSKAGKFESYLMLGFGASGKELEEKWEIKYLGPEELAEGPLKFKTEKLELVAKDPEVRKNIRRVTIWMDPEKGVSRKQVFEQSATEYRVSVYFNIKVNQPLPTDAFTLPTDKATQYVNR